MIALRWSALVVMLLALACARVEPPVPMTWDEAIAVQRDVIDAQSVWDDHAAVRRSPDVPELFYHEDLEVFLRELDAEAGDLFEQEVLIESEEGRAIHHLTYGRGDISVLIWARQHGDEDLCSSALMDVIGYLVDRRDTELVQTIQRNLTLHIVPMVNPDGVEAFTRRNAQGIDPNRDAQLRQSSSGQVLRMLYERFQPQVSFNLHDQSPRKSTDDTGALIAMSLQACPYDLEESPGPNLQRAKRICSLIEHTLQPWIGGHIARYEADYMPRAFGDSMSRWGVASILIESGGWYGTPEESNLHITKCHYIGLLSGLAAIASGAERGGVATAYDDLPLEGRNHYDLLIRDALIVDGTDVKPHLGDVGVNHRVNHRDGGRWWGTVRDVGDLSVTRGRFEISGEGLVATPGMTVIDPFASAADAQNPERVEALLQRGVTTLIGVDDDATERLVAPRAGLPIRYVSLEWINTPEAAAERHFMTSAHGFIVPLGNSVPAALADEFPQLAGFTEYATIELILVNRGRVDQNLATLVIRPHDGGFLTHPPDLSDLRPHFPHISVAVADESGLATLLTRESVEVGGELWPPTVAPEPALAGFTVDLAGALGLPWMPMVRGGGNGDIVLWKREGEASVTEPLMVILAGRLIDID